MNISNISRALKQQDYLFNSRRTHVLLPFCILVLIHILTRDMNSPHPSRQRSQQSNVDSRHYPQAFMLTIGFFSSKTLKLEMLWEALSFELKKLPIQ